MKRQYVGYIRVSIEEENSDRKEKQLTGFKLDRVFIEKVSDKDTERPELLEMMNYVKEGDILLVHSMDRLAGNLDDLRKIVKELTGRGAKVQFIRERLTFTGDDSAMSNLQLSVI